nr:CDP-2,3-bis-(O-geranylgeranyl)-sn-glycerol synthase [Candidatus Njordarchaeota archaeon]
MDILTVALSLWLIFPAYVANAMPVLVGGGTPIDLGRNFVDGYRLFGDGKTFRGFGGGLIAGTLTGVFEAFISSWVIDNLRNLTELSAISVETLQCIPSRAFLISLGALLGDLLGSFIKRRIGVKRGAPAPILDQLTFLAGAFILVSFSFPFQLEYAIILVILTPLMHLAANMISYLIGLKKVPW